MKIILFLMIIFIIIFTDGMCLIIGANTELKWQDQKNMNLFKIIREKETIIHERDNALTKNYVPIKEWGDHQ